MRPSRLALIASLGLLHHPSAVLAREEVAAPAAALPVLPTLPPTVSQTLQGAPPAVPRHVRRGR